MTHRLALAAFALATAQPALASEAAQQKEPLLWSRLRARIEAVDRGLDGVLGVAVKDLRTGASLELRPDELFPSASVIKLAVLYEAYRQAEEGRLDLGEVTRPPLPRVKGGGVLQELGERVSLSWRDLGVLMIGWSDNAATNVLIDRVGIAAVNVRLESLGLRSTRLRRRMMDVEAARQGDENTATPAELVRLLEAMRAGTGLSLARAKDIMDVAATTKWTESTGPAAPFRRPLPPELRVADKGGELEGVRGVAAVVELPGRPYAAAILTTYLKRETDAEAAIEEISRALYETFDRLARGGAYGRLIGGR